MRIMYIVNVCIKGRPANKVKLKTNYKEQREEYDGNVVCPAHARSARARRACALRALELLLADSAVTVGRGKTF